MTFACLALLALVGLGEPKPDASELVARLASESPPSVRPRPNLRRMGQDALPSGFSGKSARASALIDAIENRQLVLPTLVTLDFRERPLSEVVEAIGKQSAMTLVLDSRTSGSAKAADHPAGDRAGHVGRPSMALPGRGLGVVPSLGSLAVPARRIARVGEALCTCRGRCPGSECSSRAR